jgi:hypothetical protein
MTAVNFSKAAGTSAGKLTIVSIAVVLERLFGAALSKYRRPDIAVRPVQRTIRIGIDRHAGGFPLLGVGLMSDELAGATELQCFGRSGRRYLGSSTSQVKWFALMALSCDTAAVS